MLNNIPFVNYLQVFRNDGKGKHKAETSKHFMILNACWSPCQALGHHCIRKTGLYTSRKTVLRTFQLLSYSFLWVFNRLILRTCLCFPNVFWHLVLNMLMGYGGHCCHDLCSTNETIWWVNLSLYMPFQALIAWDHTGKAATGLTAVASCDFKGSLSYRRSPFAGWDAKLLLWTLVTFEDHRLLSLMEKA